MKGINDDITHNIFFQGGKSKYLLYTCLSRSMYSSNGLKGKGVNTMYWVTGILGIAFGIAPFVLGYTDNPAALWTSIILGAAVLVVSIIEGFALKMETWEYWTAAVLGLVSMFAPFMLGFSSHGTATWTSVIVGILVIVFAGSRLYTGHELKI